MKRIATVGLLFIGCTAHKLSTARETASEQTGCQEIVVFERTTGWEAEGCGSTLFSTSTSGPWKKMSCEDMARLNHRECTVNARRTADQRSYRGNRASVLWSALGERDDLQRCDSERAAAEQKCVAAPPAAPTESALLTAP